MAGGFAALCILQLASFAAAQRSWISGSCQGTSTLTTGLVKEVGQSACAIEKFWLPLGKVVRCIKTLHPEEQERDMSLMFPVVDEIGDLPVTKDVSAALKA
eukprot:s5136_g1.t1